MAGGLSQDQSRRIWRDPRFVDADRQLARLGRSQARERLRLGERLDALAQKGGHHELGFSSLEAYVLERCGRNRRWCRDTRGLAKRIRMRGLSATRSAIYRGELSFSKAELLVRHATPETEAELIAQAQHQTVRELRAHFSQNEPTQIDEDEEEKTVTARREVGTNELLLVEATRMLVEALNGARPSDEVFVDALIGEAETTLLGLSTFEPVEELKAPALDEASVAHLRARLDDLKRRRELESEAQIRQAQPPQLEPIDADEPIPDDFIELDKEIRRASKALAERDLQIGELAILMIKQGGFRALGYATKLQYAKERVGISLSSLKQKIVLARRVRKNAELGEAVKGGALSIESAQLIGRVLDGTGRADSQPLAQAWIERANRRTVKHLREEVDAVILTRSLDEDAPSTPPDTETLETAHEIERKVQSGELYRTILDKRPNRQMSVTFEPGPARRSRSP